MSCKKYINVEGIISDLNEYYNEAIARTTFGERVSSDKNYQNLQIKLLQTTQHFVESFDYELENTPTIKRKIIVLIKKVIRKSTRFLLKPYAAKMFRYQEINGELSGEIVKSILLLAKISKDNQIAIEEKAIQNSESELRKQNDQIWKHEEAIYKLTNEYNSTAALVLELSDKLNDKKDKINMSYSQAGEDKIIEFLMNYGEDKSEEFTYLDIGCNHYKDINNTYKFYEMGMHGVLIDANPTFIDLAQKYRPRDISVNAGIGEHSDEALNFYVLNSPGLSSFNLEVINKAKKKLPWLEVEKEIKVPVHTFNEIIEKYFIKVPEVISLDIEGDELKVLKILDLKKYRPKIFIVETIEYSVNISLNNKRNDIVDFMESNEYKEYAFTGVNSIFVDKYAYIERKV